VSELVNKITHAFCCALTSCRRVLLLLLLFVVLAFAWVWWTLPDLDQLRPEIEAGLRSEWALQRLSLGRLSWRWRGDLEIHAERLSLVSADGRIHVQDAQISLVVSIAQLVQGIWLPQRIYIRNGLLKIHLVDTEKPINLPNPTPWLASQAPLLVAYENMTLLWQYNQYRRILHHAKGFFSTMQHTVELYSDEINIQLMLDDDGQINRLKGNVDQLDWLLPKTAVQLSPHISAELLIWRKAEDTWQLFISANSPKGMITVPSVSFDLPFDRINTEGIITAASLLDIPQWQRIHFEKLFWQHGDDRIQAMATWQDGVLSLHAKSPRLQMPLLWSWLRPIDNDKEWHAWLLSMHHGVAKNSRADISLPWAEPWHTLPPLLSNDVFRYHVQSTLNDVDIHVGEDNALLLHTKATIDLNQDGLQATIHETTLPYGIGLARAALHVSWDTLMLDVNATLSNVDIMRLHRWVDPDGAGEIGWQKGRAKGNVHLLWDALKPNPESAIATLSPMTPWLFHFQDQYVTVNAGTVIWQKDKGITAKSLNFQTGMFHGTVDFDGQTYKNTWRLNTFSGDFNAPLAQLVSNYHIPIAKPSGTFIAHLAFDDDWQGSIILNDAAWDNFLGESKSIGQAMRIGFTANTLAHSAIQVNNVVCRDAGFELRGRGHINKQGMAVELERIKTQGFQGRLSIIAPRGNKPWRMTVDADYLKRSALPTSLANNKKEGFDKNWQLKANIRRFDWQDARMQGVQLTMRSEHYSPAHFVAKQVDVGSMQLNAIDVNFTMIGEGKIEVQRLHATINEQLLELTATLSPLPDGSMRWQGFASTQGDFSRMMNSSGVSTIFSGGSEQILFAGEGILMRKQPWWQGLRGRLRLRVDEGSIAKGGLLTKLLAITSLADIPALLIGQRKDLIHAGLFYKRLQIEATLNDQKLHIHQLAMRSTAMDMAGYGHYNLDKKTVDLTMVFRPLQNLDAMLDKIPLLRDLIGGAAHSFIRKVYHMYGTIGDAKIDQVSPSSAGLASPGIIEGLLTLPDRWFGGMKTKEKLEE